MRPAHSKGAGAGGRNRLALSAAAVGVSAAAVGAAVLLSDADRRTRMDRRSRVFRLTARRAVHLGVTRLRGVAADEAKRAALDEQFAIRTAEDVARELGNMKGAIMKAGQMLSFVLDGLPPEAREALSSLHADVDPMAPSLAEAVIREELGADPTELFLHWDPIPAAAASIGQVHKCVLRDGREVAVKVQYPGIDRAIRSDLDNAEILYQMFATLAVKNLDVRPIVDELRERMGDELDYRTEAACQAEFHERYRGHPFIRIPAVVSELSSSRVLTTEWVDGMNLDEFLEHGSREAHQQAAEVIFRFVQCSIFRHGVFNGDPHPGNYRFHHDGSVTFLDFGLVKRWSPSELEGLSPVLDSLVDQRPAEMEHQLVEAGFLERGHGLDPEHIWDYAVSPYRAYLSESFTFTPGYTGQALATYIDLSGPHRDVIAKMNVPPSFVILDRVVWGVSAILGQLRASNRWGQILSEYRGGPVATTPLGRLEQDWEQGRLAQA